MCLIMCLIVCTGCKILNISDWVAPDDLDFIILVDELNTPEKISDYMMDNFKYGFVKGLITPYELYLTKVGNCNDFAYFGRWIAHYHDYSTYWIRIFFTTGTSRHIIQIYVEGEYNYSTNQKYCPIQADTFRGCVLDYILYYSKKELEKFDVYNYQGVLIENSERNIVERRIRY